MASIPVSAALKPHLDRPVARAALLSGGDDYELCFTAGRARREAVARLARGVGLRLSRIGRVTRPRRGAPPVTVLDAGGRPVPLGQAGYKHF
jgi:thiamine-monophosphate kinase